MDQFLSCDWGTTSFRIRLSDIQTGEVLAEETSAEGIAQTFDRWQQAGGQEEERAAFYLDVVNRHIKTLEEKVNRSLKGTKLVISGMASASIGVIELPYSEAPLLVDGSGLKTAIVEATESFEHDVLIISGVKTADDVMRGEETQLIGCIEPGQTVKNELYIFPGTHAKHITVIDDKVIGIKTYMTGELFALLSQNSILKNNVEPGGEFENKSFTKGVNDAVSANFLNSIFKVRTNQLFNIYSKIENYSYLSGLLIGVELKDIAASGADAINLVCSGDLSRYYSIALFELLKRAGVKNIKTLSAGEADLSSVKGQLKIGKLSNFLA